MKILYLTHRFPPDHFRGTEVYTFELAREMLRRGHQVLVVAVREMKEPGKISILRDNYREVPVARICKNLRPDDFEKYFFDPEMDQLFKQLRDDFRPDLIHATYFLGGLSLGMSEAALSEKFFVTLTDYSSLCARGQLLNRNLELCTGPRDGIRCLYCLFDKQWLFSNPQLDHWARERLPAALSEIKQPRELGMIRKRNEAVKRILFSAHSMIFAHPYTREVFERNGVKAQNPRQIDFGVDFEPFKTHQKTWSSRMRIGFIGQILPHKGLDLLVDALAKVKNQDSFELLIYGSLSDPSEKTYFDSLDLRAIKNQKWFGTFDLSRMNQILEDIYLLVVPSRWPENCPLVPKYALLTGTRLLISDAPGILVKAEGEGIDSFGMGNVDMLREKIAALIDSGLWKTPVAPRRDLVMNISGHAALLDKLYKEAR